MKHFFKASKLFYVSLLVSTHAVLTHSCNDDLPANSYYTFTGEMMSDYLKSREDFSLFKRIVERAGQMDFLASRGALTFFPPINSGVEKFLQEKGYASVEEIPASYCDTLVKACLVARTAFTYNFAQTQQENNTLDLPLIIQTSGDTVDANGMTLSIINRQAAIINELKNDSVENGVVHPVDRVLVPNTSLGSSLLDQKHDEYAIFYEALRRTALLDSLARYRDERYEISKNKYPAFRKEIWSGPQQYVAKRPDHRYEGFTLFIVPDRVLYEKYSQHFNENMTMDEKIDALYDLAVEKYEDDVSAQIFGLNEIVPGNHEGKTYKELYWNRNSLTNRHNPLNMFLSYHITDRLFESTAKLVNCWGVYTAVANPTEWINPLLDFSTLKLERVYSTIDPDVEHAAGYYLNHNHANLYNSYQRVRGAYLTQPDADNFSLNVAYFYIDDVLAYDQTMRNNIMNTRLRMDFYTLWPELTNNDMRLSGNPTQAYGPHDNSENGGEAGGYNYYLPSGYLKNTQVSENSIFFVQRQKVYWSSMHGDEINLLGTSYDVTFRLPNVPPGTYELRLGYPAMEDRGIAQIYLDGVPQGIPIDMRFRANDPRVGGLYNGLSGDRNSDESSNGIYTTKQLEENARTMKNNGFYSAPKSIFYNNDGTDAPRYSPSSCILQYNLADTYRRKICNVQIQPHTHHTVRVRSVFVQGNRGCLILDYLELVPIDICGAGGIGEDLY